AAVAVLVASLGAPAVPADAANFVIGRAPHGGAGPGDPGAPSFRWSLLNPHPCVSDTVVLVVAGFESTPCESLIEAFARDSAHVVYHTQVRDSVGCVLVLPHTYPIRIPLGLFPAGPQRIDIEWLIDHVNPGYATIEEVRHIPIDFVVSAEC